MIAPLQTKVNTIFRIFAIFILFFEKTVAFLRRVWYNTFTVPMCVPNLATIGRRKKRGFIMTLGEKIKARRMELGLSVDEVAEKIGRNRATVYRYENSDIEDIPTGVLETLSKALSTTPTQLMGWSEELSDRDKKDIAQTMERFIQQLGDPNEALMFDGEPLDDESRDLLLKSLENSLTLGKMIAKKKFTPKKFQD